MDPLGFGMENFDAVGAWRDLDGTFRIDTSGVLPSGESFNGPRELRTVLKKVRHAQFCRCLCEKMLTYAIGRGLESYDRCAVDGIMQSLVNNDYRFSSLILGVTKSIPFQMKGAKQERK